MTLGVHNISEHVYTTLWLQNLHQGLLQGLLYCGSHRAECPHHLPLQLVGHRFTELDCNVCCHILSNEMITHLIQHRFHVFTTQALGPHKALQHPKHATQSSLGSTGFAGILCGLFII